MTDLEIQEPTANENEFDELDEVSPRIILTLLLVWTSVLLISAF